MSALPEAQPFYLPLLPSPCEADMVAEAKPPLVSHCAGPRLAPASSPLKASPPALRHLHHSIKTIMKLPVCFVAGEEWTQSRSPGTAAAAGTTASAAMFGSALFNWLPYH